MSQNLLGIHRQLNSQRTEINRLKTRQDTTYDDTTVVSAINILASKVATLEAQFNALDLSESEAITLPRWSTDRLTSDVTVADTDGAVEILSLGVATVGGQFLLFVNIGAIIASNNNTDGQLLFKLDGATAHTINFTVRNQEVFSFSDFMVLDSLPPNNYTFSIDLVTVTAGRTLTILGSEVASSMLING